MKQGVYFLANDPVLKWAKAFLCSFRQYNPDLPLCLIPYSANVSRLMALRDTYRFDVFDDQGVLDRCATIAEPFHPRYGQGHYRKLACWEGKFDEFIYIDVDTVVLADVSFVFELLRDHDILVADAGIPTLRTWVWKPTIETANVLDAQQIAFSANTGFVASRKEALPIESVLDRLDDAAALAPHMVLYCIEQPLLNYLFVTSGRRLASLHVLAPHLPQVWSAHSKGARVRGGNLLTAGPSYFLVHWTGKWEPRSLHRKAHAFLKRVGLLSEDSEPVSLRMPYRRLWKFYFDRAQAMMNGDRLSGSSH